MWSLSDRHNEKHTLSITRTCLGSASWRRPQARELGGGRRLELKAVVEGIPTVWQGNRVANTEGTRSGLVIELFRDPMIEDRDSTHKPRAR